MKPGYGTRYRAARAALLADSPRCAYCAEAPATEADHEPPLSSFPDPEQWVGVLVPACRRCNVRKGGANRRRVPTPSRQW